VYESGPLINSTQNSYGESSTVLSSGNLIISSAEFSTTEAPLAVTSLNYTMSGYSYTELKLSKF